MTIQGTSFVNSKTGEKFEIVGMAYQPGGESAFTTGGTDPLSDPKACMRDAALMQILGINAIRVYNLWPDNNHDECASIFNAAGIYMLIDVNGPLAGQSLTSYEPWTSYDTEYLNRTFAMAEAFGNYPNTLLFFCGNEIINNVQSAQYAPQYMRSAIRDLKNYISGNLKRQIPVGYSAADVASVLMDTLNYLQCTDDGKADDPSRSDFFAINSYSWCGIQATFQSSTYESLTDSVKNTTLPIFLSEYGCIEGGTRYWNSTQAIFGPDMDGTFSGGVAYEWTQQANDYGVVSVNGSTTYILEQYDILKEKLGMIDWSTVESLSPPKNTPNPPTCNSSLFSGNGFDTNATLIPTPSGAAEIIKNGMTNKPSGQIVSISDYSVELTVVNAAGETLKNLAVTPFPEDEFNYQGKVPDATGSNSTNSSSSGSGKDSAASSFMQPFAWAAVVPILAVIFA